MNMNISRDFLVKRNRYIQDLKRFTLIHNGTDYRNEAIIIKEIKTVFQEAVLHWSLQVLMLGKDD